MAENRNRRHYFVAFRFFAPRLVALFSLTALLLAPASLLAADNDAEFELNLGLSNRFTVKKNHVERLLRFSPSANAFDTRSYLNPTLNEVYYGFRLLLGAGYSPTKWFRVGLTVDSGELNPTGRRPATTQIPIPNRLQPVLGATVPVPSTANERQFSADGQAIGDEAKQTFFVREAYLRFSAPVTNWLSLSVGRRDSDVASGLIYRDFGLGLSVSADLELLKDWPVRLSAQVVLPTRNYKDGLHSPLVEFRANYIISFLEQAGLVFAYFHDGDNNLGQLFAPALSELGVSTAGRLDQQVHNILFGLGTSTATTSEANLFWFGLEGNKLFGDLMISGTAILQLGNIRLDNPFADLSQLAQSAGLTVPSSIPRTPRLEFSSLAVAVDLSARYLITEEISIGLFFLMLSGEQNPFSLTDPSQMGKFNAFLSVVPYITATNIFFSGGMNETFSGRQASIAGLNGRGVVAPGLTFEWEISDSLKVGSKAAALFSTAKSVHNGTFYGVEVDVEGSYEITKWLAVSAEYDILAPGSFFSIRKPIHKVLLGVDLSYELSK